MDGSIAGMMLDSSSFIAYSAMIVGMYCTRTTTVPVNFCSAVQQEPVILKNKLIKFAASSSGKIYHA